MCDYSLHAFKSRLAVGGENLVVHRFPGASKGLASPEDLCRAKTTTRSSKNHFWSRIMNWLKAQTQLEFEEEICAVCVPPGARLILRDIPKRLQRELGLREVEAVTFLEISAEVNSYRDAVRFANQREVLLQALCEGQRISVLSVTPAENADGIFAEVRRQSSAENAQPASAV
jgi:hypothetical protein